MPKKVAKKKTAKRAGVARKGGRAVARADLGADVGPHLKKVSGWQGAAARRLDAMVRGAAPKATSAIKWGMPVYEHEGMLCYIRARAGYVTLGFYEAGTALDDPKGLLQGTGQNMRHTKIASEEEMDEKYLAGLVRQAARLNEMG